MSEQSYVKNESRNIECRVQWFIVTKRQVKCEICRNTNADKREIERNEKDEGESRIVYRVCRDKEGVWGQQS